MAYICIFPVQAKRFLRLQVIAPSHSLHFSVHLSFVSSCFYTTLPKVAIDTCTSGHSCPPVDDLSCCRNKILNGDLFEVCERYSEEDKEQDDYFTFPIETYGPTQACFEVEGEFIPVDMINLMERIRKCESILSSPPTPLETSMEEILVSLKVCETSPFAIDLNEAVRSLLSSGEEGLGKVEASWRHIWFHVFLMFQTHISENAADTNEVLVQIIKQAFSEITSHLNRFWCSMEFKRYVCGLFGTSIFSIAQKTVAVEIGMQVYVHFLKHLTTHVSHEQQCEILELNVEDMSSVGKAKIRYVGGWAIRKVLEKLRGYIQKNVHSSSSHTITKVGEEHRKCEILEENVIVPYSKLKESTKLLDTLEITEERQFRERSYSHFR